MLHIRIGSSAILALLAIPVAQGQTQAPAGRGSVIGVSCSTLACDVEYDWLRNVGMTALLADAMPEDKYNFRPTPAQQSFGERVVHVADIDIQSLKQLGGKTPAPAIDVKATSKKAALASLRTASDYGSALLKEFGEAGLMERVNSPEFMGPKSSRLRIVYFLMQHTQDTYGQLVVYLRLNGIVPPLSRTP